MIQTYPTELNIVLLVGACFVLFAIAVVVLQIAAVERRRSNAVQAGNAQYNAKIDAWRSFFRQKRETGDGVRPSA